MRVGSLWRYPVKSLGGESVVSAEVTADGLAGDRGWGLVDPATGMILTARREPQLLFASAQLIDEQAVVLLPDGTQTTDDSVLSAWLGRDVELTRASTDAGGTFETTLTLDESGDWVQWIGRAGSFHDSTVSPLSLAAVDSFGDWEPKRFRINVHLEGLKARAEDPLVGSTLAVSTTSLRIDIVKQIDRCIVTTRPQLGNIERDLTVLKTVLAEHEGNLGIGAQVAEGGQLTVGDELMVVPNNPSA